VFSQREKLKRNIAIWIHGGVGTGLASQGQPVIMRLIHWLSAQYNVDVYSLSSANENFSPSGFALYSTGTNTRKGFMQWLRLIRTFFKNNRKKRYDCLYSFWGYPSGIVTYFVGMMVGLPAILHLQGGDAVGLTEPPYGIFQHRIRGSVCRYVYNRCSALIALTQIQKSFLKANGIERTVNVIPYGVDEKIFSFRAKAFSERKYKFLHVGNLTPIKGQEMLLKTFSIVCSHLNGELTIVGPDYSDGLLSTLAKSLNILDRVRFVGHQLHHDLPAFYHDAHVLIHTSLYEGQAVVFAEAASCGTMLAGTRVGMLADMGDACGICVDNRDHEQLANRIVEILHAPEEFQKLTRAAKAWVHERDEQHTFHAIQKIIDKTIQKR
jgi:glycosyltransferase involved in cell wall biosynthesis